MATQTPPGHGPTPRESVADGVITARIRSRLMMDPVTSSYSIEVVTLKSTVRLEGYVEFDAVRDQVLHIVADVSGVRQVENFLDIRRN
jgi:osmotically-inducible protein OsmY